MIHKLWCTRFHQITNLILNLFSSKTCTLLRSMLKPARVTVICCIFHLKMEKPWTVQVIRLILKHTLDMTLVRPYQSRIPLAADWRFVPIWTQDQCTIKHSVPEFGLDENFHRYFNLIEFWSGVVLKPGKICNKIFGDIFLNFCCKVGRNDSLKIFEALSTSVSIS